MDYIKAFVTGGLLCAAVQILMDKTKLMPGRIMVLFSGVCILSKLFIKSTATRVGFTITPFADIGCALTPLIFTTALRKV